MLWHSKKEKLVFSIFIKKKFIFVACNLSLITSLSNPLKSLAQLKWSLGLHTKKYKRIKIHHFLFLKINNDNVF
jgi:hypothetical protein